MRWLAALLLVVGWASNAEASTIPPLDGGPGRFTVTAGLLDLGLDFGIGPRLSAGVTAFAPPVGVVGILGAAARTTLWFTDPTAWWVLGATVSAGATYTSGASSQSQYLWAQPALNLALAPGSTGFALRATLGPVASQLTNTVRVGTNPGTTTSFDLNYLVPNVELAYRFSPNHELTFGGNSVIGWRGRF